MPPVLPEVSPALLLILLPQFTWEKRGHRGTEGRGRGGYLPEFRFVDAQTDDVLHLLQHGVTAVW